jgi:hypothetical protein
VSCYSSPNGLRYYFNYCYFKKQIPCTIKKVVLKKILKSLWRRLAISKAVTSQGKAEKSAGEREVAAMLVGASAGGSEISGLEPAD